MSERYCHIVGILGAPDAGKTALLVSLYLLLAHNRLNGFEFRDSRSIMAFEEIARGARRWNEGHPPVQMTSHTELADERTAGFLHLRLREVSSGEPVDILMPDLPGEWSDSLIDTNRVDRLDFLKSADAIWLMVDGQLLIQPQSRQHALHRTKLLMQRIAEFLAPRIPPFTLVITRRDRGTPSPNTIENLNREATRYSMSMRIAHIASFANAGEVAAGAGIADLISSTVKVRSTGHLSFWPNSQVGADERVLLRFRNRGDRT